MQMPRTEGVVSFKVWTSHRTWFWSLIYPDREGGAIGAATSEAEALHEAHAAIERLPQLRDTTGIFFAPCEDSKFSRRCQSSKDSQFHNRRKMEAANGQFECSRAAGKRRAKVSALGASYRNLWQLMLQRYAARVANA